MATIKQDLSQDNYGAGFEVTAASMFTPKRDATKSVLTAFVRLMNLVDQSGVAFGTNANPIYTTGSTGTGGAPYQATPKGYQQIVGMVASTALTVPGGATFAVISAEGPTVRWTDDGTVPTASVGMPLFEGSPPQVFSGDLAVLKFIQSAATSTLNVSYYA